jgi:dihydroorotate dehydrogenase
LLYHLYENAIFPILQKLDPETAHHFALGAMDRLGRLETVREYLKRRFIVSDHRLAVDPFNPEWHPQVRPIHFANPVGFAAGLSKDARSVEFLVSLGFGHGTVGTVLPRRQAGNEKPRIIRLPDGGLLNRMGFPSPGFESVAAKLEAIAKRNAIGGFALGISIGPNAENVGTEKMIADYRIGAQLAETLADYLEVNVSSPNTPGLREIPLADLREIFENIREATRNANWQMPVFLKMNPDMSTREIDAHMEALEGLYDGLALTNTTIRHARHRGGKSWGLSGPELKAWSTEFIRYVYRQTRGRVPIIGVGGIRTWHDALEKILAGACAVQVYTAFTQESDGPWIARNINRGLAHYLDRTGEGTVEDLVGTG